MRNGPLLLITAGILLFTANESSACTCAAITPAQGFDQAQAVFTGKVMRTKKSEVDYCCR